MRGLDGLASKDGEAEIVVDDTNPPDRIRCWQHPWADRLELSVSKRTRFSGGIA